MPESAEKPAVPDAPQPALTSPSRPDTVRGMDTMKILLGATIALLLGALVVSWQGMKDGVRNTSSDELARLSKQIEDLRIEQERLQLEKQYQQLRANEPAVAAPATSASSDLDAMRAELAAKEAALASIEEEKNKAQRDAETYRDEAGLIGQMELEKSDSELRRARLIGEALVMGRIIEYAEDPSMGNFVTLEVLMPDQVQSGSILAIRRKTGILGQVKVAEVTPEGAIGNLMPGLGQTKPEPGDELILPPQY